MQSPPLSIKFFLSVRTRSCVLLAAPLCAIALLSGCGDSGDNQYVEPPPPEVEVATPVIRDVTDYLVYSGVVEESETVRIRARVQGFLESRNFEPGQRVKKGDLLFRIESDQYEAAVAQAEASLAASQAALLAADNDAKTARNLANRNAGPELDAIVKEAKREEASAQVALAEARLANARLDLSYCEVVSPIDGRITNSFVDVGNLIGRGEPTLLAEVIQATPSYVYINATESDVLKIRRHEAIDGDLSHVKPGRVASGEWRPCELSLGDEDRFSTPGHVDYVAPGLDQDTATLRVRTKYENKNEILLPGMFATVRFPMSTYEAYLIPESALLRDQLGRYALVVDENNIVQIKRVKLGQPVGGMRVVESGLNPVDRVIVLGALKVRPGGKAAPHIQSSTEEE